MTVGGGPVLAPIKKLCPSSFLLVRRPFLLGFLIAKLGPKCTSWCSRALSWGWISLTGFLTKCAFEDYAEVLSPAFQASLFFAWLRLVRIKSLTQRIWLGGSRYRMQGASHGPPPPASGLACRPWRVGWFPLGSLLFALVFVGVVECLSRIPLSVGLGAWVSSFVFWLSPSKIRGLRESLRNFGARMRKFGKRNKNSNRLSPLVLPTFAQSLNCFLFSGYLTSRNHFDPTHRPFL